MSKDQVNTTNEEVNADGFVQDTENETPFDAPVISAAAAAKPVISAGGEINAYSSVDTSTKAGKMALYNALINPDHQVSDNINKEIAVTDVIATYFDVTDEFTGEVEQVPRIILIDVNGESYSAGSKGMQNAVQGIITAFGEPSVWDEPLNVVIKQVKVARGSMLTLQVVG